MALKTIQSVTWAGTAPTFSAVSAGGDTCQSGRGIVAIFKNSNAATRDITLVIPGTLPTGDPYPDKVYTIEANTGETWVPVDDLARDPVDGLAHFTYSADAGVTVAIVRVA